MDNSQVYQVDISDKARGMLFEHAQFLAHVSIKAAEKLFDEFEEKVSSLEIMPERCPLYSNPYVTPGKYRKLSLGKYLLILFQVVGKKVYIELVIDARMDNNALE